MTELHVRIPDDVAERLAERAEREHKTPEEIASAALRSYVGSAESTTAARRLGFIGLGRSGRSDISERAEEILRTELGA